MAMKFLIFSLLLTATLAAAQAKQTFTGTITDSMCPTSDHSRMRMGPNDPECAAAQEWTEYVDTQNGFKLNFPGQPKVTETTWTSQMNYTLPGRVYSAEKGRERYSLTVVDYGGLEQQAIERSKTCPPGNAQCRPNAGPVIGPAYWKQDERGAIVYATLK